MRRAAGDPDDPAGLLEDPERVGVAGRGADLGRAVQTGGDALDREGAALPLSVAGRALGAARRRRAPRATAASEGEGHDDGGHGERRGRTGSAS